MRICDHCLCHSVYHAYAARSWERATNYCCHFLAAKVVNPFVESPSFGLGHALLPSVRGFASAVASTPGNTRDHWYYWLGYVVRITK